MSKDHRLQAHSCCSGTQNPDRIRNRYWNLLPTDRSYNWEVYKWNTFRNKNSEPWIRQAKQNNQSTEWMLLLWEHCFISIKRGKHIWKRLNGAGENRQSDTTFDKNGSYQDKISLKHTGTQTMFTSLRKYDDPAKFSGRYRRRKKDNEFTYINLDPEQCLRCSNFGCLKCSLCSAPYCSPRCKSKDFKEHRNQCPERRLEEKQRQEKDQEYEIRIKSLSEDIERLKDHGLCKICLEEEARVVFDPCGHLCCCDNCSKQLKACPMCRDDVQKSIKVFT